MTKQKLSMSEKIRRQLELGKSVKEISKYLKCSPALIYAVRSADKKKNEKVLDMLVEVSRGRKEAVKPKAWKSAAVVTSATSIVKQRQNDILDTLAMKPGAVRYGDVVMVPKDYPTPKRNFVQRFFNWICGG